jgi:hypothetical protein
MTPVPDGAPLLALALLLGPLVFAFVEEVKPVVTLLVLLGVLLKGGNSTASS